MASMGTSLKREAITQGWSLWILSATGESPFVERHDAGANIKWRPGQAKKMEQYLLAAMKGGEPDPNDANVSVPLGPVLIPLVIKKYIGYAAAYTALLVIGTKLIWK